MARRYGRLAISRRVLVNMVDGDAIDGVLWDERGPLIVLRDAHMHVTGAGAAEIDGEVIIDRDRIQFVQVLS